MKFETPEALVEFAIAVIGREAPKPDAPTVRTFQRELGRFAHAPGPALLAALDAVLVHQEAAAIIDLLHSWGAIRLWLPEVAAMDGLHESAEQHHKDLWAHTLQVLAQSPAEADLRWVALCHDIGKPSTRAYGPDGVSFWRHEGVGAWLFRGIGARLHMAPHRVDRIAFVIEHHARTNQYEDSWSDKALRRLKRESGPFLDDMLAFSRADWSTRRMGRVHAIHAGLDRLISRLDALAQADAADPTLPAGLADAVLAATGQPGGPWLGALLREVRASVESRPAGATALSLDEALSLALATLDADPPQNG